MIFLNFYFSLVPPPCWHVCSCEAHLFFSNLIPPVCLIVLLDVGPAKCINLIWSADECPAEKEKNLAACYFCKPSREQSWKKDCEWNSAATSTASMQLFAKVGLSGKIEQKNWEVEVSLFSQSSHQASKGKNVKFIQKAPHLIITLLSRKGLQINKKVSCVKNWS